MIIFAKSYLSSSIVSCKMFYDFDKDTFDFKVYDTRGGTNSICFCFHFLPALDYELGTDYWLEA